MYRQLLLSTGGGVMSSSQMDKQSTCATVAIGLGGTGVACLRNLKRRVYSSLQPDNPNSVVPTYEHIKFLAVDTDKGSLDSQGNMYDLDEATEFFDISSGNIQGLLSQTKVLAGQPECAWLKNKDESNGEPGLSILSATAGAGGVRQIGRLLLIEKSLEFVRKVELLVNQAKAGLPKCDVNIHIFTGMGGGTGAGTFLDACYLVQQALKNISEDGHALVCGYFFLPDVNLSVPTVAANPSVAEYIKINGFASMKELDYCMNFDKNHGEWDQEYCTFHVKTSAPPVKLCHLISANVASGAVLKEGFPYAMNVVTDYVMQFLVESQGFTLQSHISNFYNEMNMVSKTHGANYGYCVLGASNAVIPMREITTYLSSKLFEGMSVVAEQTPTDGEIQKFAEENGLTFKQLFQAMLKGTSYQLPVLQLDHKSYGDLPETDLGMPDEIHLPSSILGSYRTMEEKMTNKIEANKQALLHEWRPENIDTERDSVSKMCKAYYALADVVCDAARGPIYAANVLKGAGRKNLVDLLRGVLAETQTALNHTKGDVSLRISSVKAARKAFLHPGFMQSKSRLFAEFLTTVQQLESTTSRIHALEEMESMVHGMIEQFEKLYETHFRIYAQVTINLMKTFHQNYLDLNNPEHGAADPFVVPLMTIQDLKPSLDHTVASMKLDSEMTSFHSMLFANSDAWLAGDEQKISKCVSEYLLKKFSGYTSKTLTDYLEIRFNTTNPVQLADCVYKDIMMPLSEKATPLFWLSARFSIESAGPLGYCSVPDSATAVGAAANKMALAHPEMHIIPNKMPDRISLLRCSCGVPMFGYIGVDNFAPDYKGKTMIGNHLYQKTARDPRDWRTLSDLAPYSVIEHPDQKLLEASDLYDRAVELGIIKTENNMDYHLYLYPAADDLCTQAQEAMKSGNLQQIQAAKAQIEDHLRTRTYSQKISIPNDGAPSHEEKVRKDHVVASEELISQIREELEKMDKLNALIEELDQQAKTVKTSANLREEFYNAMMTGVFQYKIPTVTYTKEVYGMTEDFTLSDPKTEPYGKAVPLYQAYLSYGKLSSEERQAIVDLSDERMSMMDPALKEACTNLCTIFTPQYMGMQQRMLERAEPDAAKVSEIKQFLLVFRQGIDDFMGMYGLN